MEATNAANLTLNDFSIVIQIIDMCSQRGAFRGDELSSVGQLRDKFEEFVKENTTEAVKKDSE